MRKAYLIFCSSMFRLNQRNAPITSPKTAPQSTPLTLFQIEVDLVSVTSSAFIYKINLGNWLKQGKIQYDKKRSYRIMLNFFCQFSHINSQIKKQQSMEPTIINFLKASCIKQSVKQYQNTSIYDLQKFEMNTKNLGKPLTADLVFTKTKSDSLHNIKNLNLWGNDLEDLSLIEKMPNLEVISLSVNRISSLKDFSKCYKLQELYLRKNNISDIREIRHLVNLPTLKVLWLHDNPCAQIENYREITIKNLPHLMKLDNNPVTPEERASSQNVVFSLEVPNESNFKSEKPQVAPEYLQQKKARPSSNYYQPQHQKQQERQSNYYTREPKQPRKFQQKIPKKGGMQNVKKVYDTPKQQDINRNQNILMAVLSLLRQLDPGSLEIVRRQTQKMLH